ncbi:MAG: DUF4384 domain-containing protein [Hyphomicrobium sp.]
MARRILIFAGMGLGALGRSSCWLTLFGLIALPCVQPATAIAEQQSPSAASRALFERACATCHQNGRTAAGRSPDRFANILNLDEIAADPSLVIPTLPDASPIYQRLLGGHRPLAVYDAAAGGKAPTPAEIEAVRAWISGLPAQTEDCSDRKITAQAETQRQLSAWLAEPPQNGTKLVSLEPHYYACEPAATLAAHRATVEHLLGALARQAKPPHIETLGDASAIIAVRLASTGLSEELWQRLTKGAPSHTNGAIPADWLAARLLSHPRGEDGSIDPDLDVTLDAAGLERAAALARAWERNVDLRRAASEIGIDAQSLKTRLLAVEGDELVSARRLVQGSLPRRHWMRLAAHLTGNPVPPHEKRTTAEYSIDVALFSDKPLYVVGDLLTLNVSVSKACHLTLVNIDAAGKGLVLYPNDIEPDNLIAPGVVVRVPGPTAGYQLRFDTKGSEGVVALCQRTSRNFEGVRFDHERQRFAILGDWQEFLRTAAERKAESKPASPDGRASRRRRSSKPAAPPELPAIDPTGPNIEGRAAIAIPVE